MLCLHWSHYVLVLSPELIKTVALVSFLNASYIVQICKLIIPSPQGNHSKFNPVIQYLIDGCYNNLKLV